MKIEEFTTKLLDIAINDTSYAAWDKPPLVNNPRYADLLVDYLGGGVGAAIMFNGYQSSERPGFGSISGLHNLSGIEYYQYYRSVDPRVSEMALQRPDITYHTEHLSAKVGSSEFIDWLRMSDLNYHLGMYHCFDAPHAEFVTGVTIFPKHGVEMGADHFNRLDSAAKILKYVQHLHMTYATTQFHNLSLEYTSEKGNEGVCFIDKWARLMRNKYPLSVIWASFCRKMRGHINYYGVSHNIESIKSFLHFGIEILYKQLNRRSQKRSFTWDKFTRFRALNPEPLPKIRHHLF